jgi:hypothetical protein
LFDKDNLSASVCQKQSTKGYFSSAKRQVYRKGKGTEMAVFRTFETMAESKDNFHYYCISVQKGYILVA